ncbi:SPFH domain-containing protein [Candidatus Chlorohelix sp.]|uniref:SPFH domain-containing protein n=1 Tax=Candidatus Chlorohelix sp. TaxID=3139201 RepID=UPI00305EA7A1
MSNYPNIPSPSYNSEPVLILRDETNEVGFWSWLFNNAGVEIEPNTAGVVYVNHQLWAILPPGCHRVAKPGFHSKIRFVLVNTRQESIQIADKFNAVHNEFTGRTNHYGQEPRSGKPIELSITLNVNFRVDNKVLSVRGDSGVDRFIRSNPFSAPKTLRDCVTQATRRAFGRCDYHDLLFSRVDVDHLIRSTLTEDSRLYSIGLLVEHITIAEIKQPNTISTATEQAAGTREHIDLTYDAPITYGSLIYGQQNVQAIAPQIIQQMGGGGMDYLNAPVNRFMPNQYAPNAFQPAPNHYLPTEPAQGTGYAQSPGGFSQPTGAETNQQDSGQVPFSANAFNSTPTEKSEGISFVQAITRLKKLSYVLDANDAPERSPNGMLTGKRLVEVNFKLRSSGRQAYVCLLCGSDYPAVPPILQKVLVEGQNQSANIECTLLDPEEWTIESEIREVIEYLEARLS